MTTDNAVPLVLGGVAVHDRLLDDLPALASAVVERLRREVPVYRTLPAEQLTGDVLELVKQTIRTFVAALRAGRLPGPEDLVALRRSAAVRAEDGIPVDAVIGAHHVGAQACVDFVARAADPQDLPDVLALNRLVLTYMRRTSAAVSAGYADAYRAMSSEDHEVRRSLLSALLDGEPADAAAERTGLRLPAQYRVVSVALGAHPDERATDVDPAVAARRKLRRLRGAVDRSGRGPVLSVLTTDGGLVLIPQDATPAPDAWLDGVVAGWSAAAGADVLAATVLTEPDGVPAAVQLANELRHVAAVVGRPPGVYRLPDLLLDYQLTRPSPAREELAALLAPVEDRPELLRTLRAYLDGGLNRRRAAREVRVHPNTVDYRLRRLAELTGLDATRPEHLLTAQAALAARDATGTGPAAAAPTRATGAAALPATGTPERPV